jgi:tetratricopeptide (TPR) repeat protein
LFEPDLARLRQRQKPLFRSSAAMSGPSACLSPSSRFLWRACRFGWCLGLGLVLGLGLAARPAVAAGAGVDCLSGGKASPAELMAACSAIVDDASTSRADLAAALVARADARARTSGGLSQALADLDRAIGLDGNARAYRLRGDLTRAAGGSRAKAEANLTRAIALDPRDAEAFEQRGIVYTNRHRFDRAKALADYEATLRLDPGNENAIEGRRAMKAEIARFGAQTPAPLHAPEAHPSFDCGTVRLAVEKAICADPELGALDQQVADTYTRLLNASAGRSADILRRAQRDFIARRNAGFGKPDYDLEKAMKERLDKLLTVERK